jgi:hypothetical protein
MAGDAAPAAASVYLLEWSDVAVLAVLAVAVFTFFYYRRAAAAKPERKASTFALKTPATCVDKSTQRHSAATQGGVGGAVGWPMAPASEPTTGA